MGERTLTVQLTAVANQLKIPPGAVPSAERARREGLEAEE